MERPLLRTRLSPPPAPRRFVRRARLLDTLEMGVPEHRLVLVSAPAGYGKTTLAAEWARESRLPVAWLAADPADQTVERFLRHLFAAWVSIEPELETSPPGLILSGMMPDTDAVLDGLVNFATETGREVAIVIDDCDMIESPEILGAIARLLDTLPSSTHLVLTGRAEPALPLARYRARQEMLELSIRDLQLTSDECRALVSETMGLDLDTEDVDRLNDRLEGWVAGLQLASLAIRAGSATIPEIAETGRQRFIADFLRDEVLARLSTDTRQFLLRTSIVDRLCGSLCDALTGSSHGQAMLDRLERQHVFTISLDAGGEWFRYHGLMADVLRNQLARELPGELPLLHARSARWYLEHNQPDPAFEHAMASGELPLVYEVLNRWGLVTLFTGQFHTAQAWLDAIPESWYARQPDIGLLRVALLLFTGQFERAFGMLDGLERTIAGADVVHEPAMARVKAVRCFIACELNDVEQAERFAEVALGTLPTTDTTFRAGIFGALGDVYRRNGRWSEAEHYYHLALHHSDTFEGYVQSVHAFGALADLSLRRGRLREAADHWRQALAIINDRQLWGAYELPVIGWVHLRLGEIYYEWNRLDEVRQHLEIGREQARLGGDPLAMIAGGLLATRLSLATGDLADAEQALKQTWTTIADAQFPEWRAELERCQVELWLAQGRLRDAVIWSDDALGRDASALPDQEPVTLAIARVLILKGDAPASDHALRLLDSLIVKSEAEGRTGLRIAALALRALALSARGDTAGALAALEPALRLASPDGYVRSFIDLGLPMARLLQEAAARGVMTEYVSALLDGFSAVPLASGRTATRLPEPLSERELEVLNSIAAGLTNREIADALFISPETVKKHTGSIYGKLDVRGRTQAVARARALDLLG